MSNSNMVSSFHNYLVEGKLRMELDVGAPEESSRFFISCHRVRSGEPMPLISGRFFNRKGEFLLQMEKNDLLDNPNGFSVIETRGGWALMDTEMEAILSAEVREFGNSYLTIIRGNLFDSQGRVALKGDDFGLHLGEN